MIVEFLFLVMFLSMTFLIVCVWFLNDKTKELQRDICELANITELICENQLNDKDSLVDFIKYQKAWNKYSDENTEKLLKLSKGIKK